MSWTGAYPPNQKLHSDTLEYCIIGILVSAIAIKTLSVPTILLVVVLALLGATCWMLRWTVAFCLSAALWGVIYYGVYELTQVFA